MDVLNEQVIDIGLKMIGYLVAAGLGMLLHSVIAQRRRSASALIEARETMAGPHQSASTPGLDVQFVDLRRRQGDALPSRTHPLGNRPTLKTDGRRDRLEIIRLARQMLQAGTPAELVRRMLPISDAELAFLQSATAQ
jgi:hypothetical protein